MRFEAEINFRFEQENNLALQLVFTKKHFINYHTFIKLNGGRKPRKFGIISLQNSGSNQDLRILRNDISCMMDRWFLSILIMPIVKTEICFQKEFCKY